MAHASSGSRTPHIALVTAAAARDLDEDLPPLIAALRAHADVRCSIVDWDGPAIDWSAFDVAVLRSTWDYSLRLGEFLDWATRIAAQTRLLNPLAVVRWNTDKHYLHELAAAGVRTVPSAFVEPDADAAGELGAFLDRHAAAEFVVKPAIGAGSRDAQRYGREQRADALAHVRRLQAARRSVLLQPYLASVDAAGETALVFFGGRFSHAIRKGPLLRRGEGPTRALFATEHIMARAADPAERALAEATLAAIPVGTPAAEGETVHAADGGATEARLRARFAPLLYARVDLIPDDEGNPVVLEVELTEPSLFFAHAEGSAQRFADAVAARL